MIIFVFIVLIAIGTHLLMKDDGWHDPGSGYGSDID
jgi:hypothetical protein